MELNLTFLILVLMILSCENQQKEITPKQEAKSRIKNEDLKKIIPHLLDIIHVISKHDSSGVE